MSNLSIADIVQAHRRVAPYIHETPVVESSLLNEWLGHEIYFKAECLQTIGAFKIRGAINFITKLAETESLPKRIVANSSGNHAQAVAYAARLYGIPATIFTTQNVSSVKAAATESYGAEVRRFATRAEADSAVKEASQEPDTVWIPPFNHEDIITGQGTAAFEALMEIGDVDSVFAPCGGGGLISGTFISTRALSPKAKVIGCEPLNANDAAESRRKGSIQHLAETPVTLADGAATPAVGNITFPYIQQLDDFFEVNENDIAYWTQWLQHLLKLHVEPTSAMCMGGVVNWLKQQSEPKRVLVILSGGNISEASMSKIWSEDHLSQLPSL